MNGLPWFRMYHEFATDPKVQMLSESDQRRFVMLLCLRCCNGHVTLQDADVAFQLRVSEPDWLETKGRLIARNLIDGSNKPTAWEVRQKVSDSSKSRVYKHRAKAVTRQKRICNVTETVQSKIERESKTENKKESPRPPLGVSTDDMPSHVKPVADWNQAFSDPVENHSGVIRTEAGCIQLVNGTHLRWLEKFGSPARLDLALIEIAGEINPGSRKPLAADVEARLARKVAEKIDKDERYQAAVASNAAAKAAPKRVKLSRWGA